MPGYLRQVLRPGRLNITFRDVRNGHLDTTQFPKYRVTYESSATTPCEEEKQDI